MGERGPVTSETLTVVVRHDPNPDCETCGGEGLFVDGELEEQVDCPCAEDQYRRPTPADLAAHVALLPEGEQIALLVALVKPLTAKGPAPWRDGDKRCHCTHCDYCGRLFRSAEIGAHRDVCVVRRLAVGLIHAEVARG